MKSKRIYLYPRYRLWDQAFRIGGTITPVRARWDIDSDGFIEVFTSKKAYHKHHKDVEPIVMMVAENKP